MVHPSSINFRKENEKKASQKLRKKLRQYLYWCPIHGCNNNKGKGYTLPQQVVGSFFLI